MGISGGKYHHDGSHCQAVPEFVRKHIEQPSACSHSNRSRFGSACAVCVRHNFQPNELPFLQSRQENAAGNDLQKAAALGFFLQREGKHLRGGAGCRGGRGPVGNLFRRLSVPVFLCHAGALDLICGAELCKLSQCHCAAGLRTHDSRDHRADSAVGKETSGAILEPIHHFGRHLSGKFAGSDNRKNLSG